MIKDAQKIDGVKIADGIIGELKTLPTPKKILAAVLVGEDPASISFLKQKEKTAGELGVDFRIYRFSANSSQDKLRKEIGKIAKLSRVGGIIVQLPLPEHTNRRYVLNAIPPEKDIDVLSEKAQEAFRDGKSKILPPAVGVVDAILTTYNLQLTTLKVAVVGLGFLVGKPISEWIRDNPSAGLRARCAELYLLDKDDDFSILKNADLVISGAGEPGLIKPEMLKEDAGVIDFGYSIGKEQRANGKSQIRGDFDPSSLVVSHKSLVYTPTPGGTGPILVAKLFENFYKLSL